jgi:hypothetical protein
MKLYKRPPYIPPVVEFKDNVDGKKVNKKYNLFLEIAIYILGVWFDILPSPSLIGDVLDLVFIQAPPILLHRFFL